jgi:hypothetical protein
MSVTPSGYADADNNVTSTITVLSATVLECELGAGNGSTEAGTGNERIFAIPPTVAAGESFHGVFTGSAANLRIGAVNMGARA